MSGLPYLDAAAIHRLLPMADAVGVLEGALADGTAPGPTAPRQALPAGDGGQLLVMPAAGESGVGVKLATAAPPGQVPRIQGVYVHFDVATLAPVALLDGVALTALRTPAVSAVATARLAVADAQVLTVFGAGVQAWGHVVAMAAVRPLREVRVVTRRAEPGRALVERIRAELGVLATTADPESVRDADIVCTCTTSREPVFDGALLPAHAHVNAVGSHEPDVREVDGTCLQRAAVVVETREHALAEKGDLLLPLRAGRVGEDAIVADLAELVRGDAVVDRRRLTAFLSSGMAWQDLVVAGEIIRRAAG